MSIQFCDKEKLEKIVKGKIKNTSTVLDIGCGIRPQTFITPIVHICAEPFEQYAEKIQEISNKCIDRNYIIIKSTWEETIKLIPENSVDSIFILDVIEHIEKSAGEKLLKATEKIAKKQIIIFTPLGFLPQENAGKKDAWGLDGGDWQEHKSGWLPDDFDSSWEIYASKEYHCFDNNGIKYEKPYGAFYAIKTKKEKQSLLNKITKKCLLFNNIIITTPSSMYNKYQILKQKALKRLYGNKKI
jgi:hypothetical protein